MKQKFLCFFTMFILMISTTVFAEHPRSGNDCYRFEVESSSSPYVIHYVCLQGVEYIIDGKRRSCAANGGWTDQGYFIGGCPSAPNFTMGPKK